MRYPIMAVRRMMLGIGSRQHPMWRFRESAIMAVLTAETREM